MAALNMIKDHPIVGIGFENFRIVYPHYRPPGEGELFQDVIPTMVHNGYLQTAVTNGIPALILYITFLFCIFVLLIETYKKTNDRKRRSLLIAFVASITGYLVQDMFGWLDIALSTFFWVVLGLAVSSCAANNQKALLSSRKSNVVVVFVSLCAVILIYLSVDATRKIFVDKLFWKSQSLKITTDWNQIEENIVRGLKVVPKDFYYEDMAGLFYLKRLNEVVEIDTYTKGVSIFENAISHNPFDPGVLIHRIDIETIALLKGIIKENTELETDVCNLLAMDKNNPSVYEAVAKLRVAENRYADALSTLHKAKILGEKEEGYYLLEGDIYRALKDDIKAINSYSKVVLVSEEKGFYNFQWKSAKYGIVFSLIDKGEFNEALHEIGDVIKHYPVDVYSYIVEGDIYGYMNNFEKAKESFQNALNIDPSNLFAKRGYQAAE